MSSTIVTVPANNGKSIVKDLLKKFVSFNFRKKFCRGTIRVSQVETMIKKMRAQQYERILKVYWAISVKNQNYKNSFGVDRYSACDIYNIVVQLLKKNSKKAPCVRTIQRDIKMLNDIGFIRTKLRKFGKDNIGHGSIAHYIQNMELVPHHKQIIWEYLVAMLEQKLESKMIFGDFDEDIKNAVFDTKKYCKPLQSSSHDTNILHSNSNVTSSMSPHSPLPVINKANISISNYKNSKNSIHNLKIQKNNIFTEKKDVVTRLIKRDIPKDFIDKVGDLSNNEQTYVNALHNLEMALDDNKQGKLKYVLEHFLERFTNCYRYKVWMMMKRTDGAISDYDVIWKERFTGFVQRKVVLNDYVKNVLAMEARSREERIREREKRINGQQSSELLNNPEQDTVNWTPPKKIYEKISKSNIVKDSLGFKGLKGVTLDSLGISKKVI
ncbi:plasmid maintenance protein [Borreliella bavariensis]|uniref:plasmid maintenance protein n=1 Tax=Borreliella bavariensis TaxID=664662 RepID=UPI001C007E5C|nr:plasmid maintenance protein [Borreliella bavariensis]